MFDWTPTMSSCNRNPAFEPFYRAAVTAACTALDELLRAGKPAPDFSGGKYRTAKNVTADLIVAAIEEAAFIPFGDTAPRAAVRQEIITFAVQAAHMVVREHLEATCKSCLARTKSDESAKTLTAGWAHFAETLSFPPRNPKRDDPNA